MTDNVAALIAFFALGANVLAAGLHLLFNPFHRIARWFVGWTAVWIVVLLAQGMSQFPDASATWTWILARSAFMLPALFLAFALVMARGWSAGRAFTVVGCWALVMVGGDVEVGRWPDWAESAWYGMWICGVATMWGCSKGELFPGKEGRLTKQMLGAALFLFAPVTIVATWLGGNWYGLYVAPVSSIVLQFLFFIGIVRFRFYDVEVSAARRSDIAARATEAERLAVVGELAASVAHEVRNPLTGVRSLAQRLAEDSVDDDKRREEPRQDLER